jgi:hypothetical protein
MAGQYGVPVAAGFAIDDPGMPPLWQWLEVSRSVPALASTPDVTALSFAHALVRDAVYDELSPSRRTVSNRTQRAPS